MNRYCATGWLATDPEKRTSATGQEFTRVRLAVRTGRDETLFLNAAAFETTGKFIATYLKKGDAVAFEARLHPDEWEKDGVRHREVKMVITDINSTTPRADDTATDSEPAAQPAAPQADLPVSETFTNLM